MHGMRVKVMGLLSLSLNPSSVESWSHHCRCDKIINIHWVIGVLVDF